MAKIVIFDGFATVRFMGDVVNKSTTGTSGKAGWVDYRGKMVYVRYIEDYDGEWWGRT